MLTGFILGTVFGVIATLVFNRIFPDKIDKLTREAEDEINAKLRGD